MQVEVHIVNAFVDGDAGGNPAGVVVDANGLTAEQKLRIARDVGLSETAFVSSSAQATLKLEFFTPSRQIAHCGHATVATFSLLRQLGLLAEGKHSKETVDGCRDVVIAADQAFMAQRAPTYAPLAAGSAMRDRALHSLGLVPGQLLDTAPPTVVNTGNSFLVIGVREEATLGQLRPDFSAITAVSEALDLIGYYVFTRTTKQPGRAAGARMFAPRYGIEEEAGTGMAAGPLACFLHDVLGVRPPHLTIEQGWLMQPPSPSVIAVDLQIRDGAISGLMAGGRAQAMRLVRLTA